MTEVEFHTGLADPLDFACRLLRKAAARKARVVVHAAEPALQRLDQALWTFDALAFVPHAMLRDEVPAAARLARHTPVWLCADPSRAPHHEVLVNLGPDPAPGFESFGRLIELVGADAQAARSGRERWKYYSTRGYSMVHHSQGDSDA